MRIQRKQIWGRIFFFTAVILSITGPYLVSEVSSQSSFEWPVLILKKYALGLSGPTHITHAGDGRGRLFVVEQEGRVKIIKNGNVQAGAFLDISSRVGCCGEQGLLSIAFPPNYASKNYFYVNYTDLSGDTVIARFMIGSNPDIADPNSEEILLKIDQPYANHNGGQLAFGPDGYLYVGMGDGGSAGDPQNYAQNPDSLLGKILRIDVESGTVPYSIPESNPFAGVTGYKPEIWALGLRNPWRFSFDTETGDLYIADVGQNLYEEINYQSVTSRGGENYGWRIMEGLHCYNPDPCTSSGLILPVAEYDHSQGCSVSGGIVYRGAKSPRMRGIYFYGDYCSGNIWGLRKDGGSWHVNKLLNTGFSISTFGEDELGEIYLADHAGGDIYMLINDEKDDSRGCFITGMYGPHNSHLKSFYALKAYLQRSAMGNVFVTLYYKSSPVVAEVLDQHAVLKAAAKCMLDLTAFSIENPVIFWVMSASGFIGFFFYVQSYWKEIGDSERQFIDNTRRF